MTTPRTRAIVNPNSSHGRTRHNWPKMHQALEAAIGPVEVAFTDAQNAATALTRAALHDGVDLIIAVGGDGTVNEVVNGFFHPPTGPDNTLIRPQAALALFTSGSGGDFRRSFDLPLDLPGQVARLARASDRPIDIGRLDYTDHDGQPAARYFNNIASFGLSGLVSRRVNQATFSKRINSRFAFFWATLRAMFGYQMPRVRITADDQPPHELGINTAAVCNGRYFGAGMHFAPNARPDDGRFDVVIMHDMTTRELLRDPNAVYHGKHIHHPKVLSLTARRVVAEPLPGPPALLDVDGETPGRLPATFTILPAVLKFRC
ncbi:MAG: diacylglycerol kinase family lipid kinase [Myxococcales bacterium]|nr:diacylglycerol kinase family lipid kinase [Myxococcales bacterium]